MLWITGRLDVSNLKEAIEFGFGKAKEYNDYTFFKEFKEFKKFISTHKEWEDVRDKNIRRLFVFEMFEQGLAPKSIDVSDYINGDTGTAYIENYFSNNELEKIEVLENINEEEFLFHRNLGVDYALEIIEKI